jgi:hypothetical protein
MNPAAALPASTARAQKPAKLEETIVCHRAAALALIKKAAADLGDTVACHVTSSDASRETATKLLHDHSSEKWDYVKGNIFLFAGAFFGGFLLHMSGNPYIKYTATAPWTILVGLCFIVAAATVIDTATRLYVWRNDEAKFVEAFGKLGGNVWGIGTKAVYAVDDYIVQTIRIDAIGSADMIDDYIVIKSRFGQPTVSLKSPVSDLLSQDDILADIRARIA